MPVESELKKQQQLNSLMSLFNDEVTALQYIKWQKVCESFFGVGSTKGDEMALYEVAVIAKDDDGEHLIFGPTAVCAKDKQGAIARAMLGVEIAPEYRNSMEVLVRPFV